MQSTDADLLLKTALRVAGMSDPVAEEAERLKQYRRRLKSDTSHNLNASSCWIMKGPLLLPSSFGNFFGPASLFF